MRGLEMKERENSDISDMRKDMSSGEESPGLPADGACQSFSGGGEAVAAEETGSVISAGNAGEVGAVLPETKSKKRNRIWEIDLLRGICILLVVFDHITVDFIMVDMMSPFTTGFGKVALEVSMWYRQCGWRYIIQPFVLNLFIVLSGISCSLSRSNVMRGVRMITVAGGFTVVTYIISQIFYTDLTIVFNIIHVLALSILFWALLEAVEKYLLKRKLPWWVMLSMGLLFVLVGETFALGSSGYKPMTEDLFYPAYLEALKSHGQNSVYTWLFWNNYYSSADFHPLFPAIGYFILGVMLGRKLYSEKKETLFPKAKIKPLKWLCYCGSHSIWIYFCSQIVFFLMIYGLNIVIN